MSVCSSREVLEFWCTDRARALWFSKDPEFDADIRDKFFATYTAAVDGHLEDWMEASSSALALCITLDQFPRNMFRGVARSWANDPLALSHARRAVDLGYDHRVDRDLAPFFYLPYMHAEDRTVQAQSVELYRALGDAQSLRFALAHQDIIERFGRFPHRNAVIGRSSTAEEIEFLKTYSGF
ncbi:hypothetical protein BFP70_07035 [Thioclava sp. SK-1]|uniref:DUF924 family protein n=1 Tax=Thioclava sp. SK-1 TaxID=1889770 RepID=UPI00082547B3|nr:DUF924 family protein [Thioclava sp. SK-1]OCX66171.1 hypothetical protein BFP70_07035 [Thioclava sp. SK-1]